jgi:hypothetical protein
MNTELKINFDRQFKFKLNQKIFTTIRKFEKFDFYNSNINKIFDIFLDNKFFCKALLKKVEVKHLDLLSPEIIRKDTGMEYEDAMQYLKEHGIENQAILLFFEKIK